MRLKWTIGLRNLKTGLAICLCVIVAALMRLEYPFYAAIATIISMENSVTNSFTAGKHRTMGTFVGAIVGAGFAMIEPGNAVYCALGVIVVIYVCNLLKWNKSISIGCIVFLAIMLNLQPGESPIFYGINRITDTLIGIAVAVIVNLVVFPPKHEADLEKARKAVAKRMADLFGQITTCREAVDLQSFRAELGCLEKYYQLCKEEFHLTRDLSESMEQIGKEIESYRHIYEHLVILQQLLTEHQQLLVDTEYERSDSAGAGNRNEEQQYKIETVYEYHADWIYTELQKLGLPLPIKERGRFQTKAELKIS
ncbi:MAG: aromatic acid exporter family protein [Paenibacillus sp.]|uniref:FUSC family protein n=1 Tax=Paenibacillus sp. TaxID=58172 RepID=UPI00290EB31D|nr:aromatic acid exporter family protein [Paenibacillus sp.]MDU4698814.1 aromatic acid exporter family protein [Paenibacillus sp.]